MLARFLILTIIAIAALSANLDNAKAFDAGTCNSIFPGGVDDVDWLKVNASGVDFGDGWHWDGSPTDYAVVCWASDGSVSIRGRLYADSPAQIKVGIIIRYERTWTDGWLIAQSPLISYTGQNGGSASIRTGYGNWDGPVDVVRIRLVNCGSTNDCVVVREITRNRGD